MLLGVRYYDPLIGRFITPDPSRDGLNWYAYAGNNPVRNVDPDGLSYFSDVGQVFMGYTDIVNPVNLYHGAAALYSVAKDEGVSAAGSALVQGTVETFTLWATTDDPREFGQSFGTVVLTAAAGAGAAKATTGAVAKARAAGGNAARTAATNTSRAAFRATLRDVMRPQKLEHVFHPRHNLDALVKQLGSQKSVVKAVTKAVYKQRPLCEPGSSFTTSVRVGGHNVTATGAIVDGMYRIGNFWIGK